MQTLALLTLAGAMTAAAIPLGMGAPIMGTGMMTAACIVAGFAVARTFGVGR